MSTQIPECSIEFVCALKDAEEAYELAFANAQDAADATMRPLVILMDDTRTALSEARRQLFVLLLQSGVKRKAAQRIAFGAR